MATQALSIQLHKDIMLEYHLQHNIFPNQLSLLNFAQQAIMLVNHGRGCEHVIARQGTRTGKLVKYGENESFVSASEMVENFKLECFLDNDDECVTDSDFWDCECEDDYIHLKSTQPECEICDTIHTEQPDSRISELYA